MRIALAEAQAAAAAGETPVGALVRDPATGEILAMAGNAPISRSTSRREATPARARTLAMRSPA